MVVVIWVYGIWVYRGRYSADSACYLVDMGADFDYCVSEQEEEKTRAGGGDAETTDEDADTAGGRGAE